MPNIRHELTIGAGAGKVFDAITRQDGLAAWWTPGATAKAERDSVARFAFGPDYFKEMRIVELTPPRRVQWLCIKGDDEWVGTTIAFELDAGTSDALLDSHPEAADQIEQLGRRGEATLLSLSHDGWKDDTPMFAECNYTWGRFLHGLKLLCETGAGRPWPHQHAARF